MSAQEAVRGPDSMIDVYLSNFCLLEANLKRSIITTAEPPFNKCVCALRESAPTNCLLFLIQLDSFTHTLRTKPSCAFLL